MTDELVIHECPVCGDPVAAENPDPEDAIARPWIPLGLAEMLPRQGMAPSIRCPCGNLIVMLKGKL